MTTVVVLITCGLLTGSFNRGDMGQPCNPDGTCNYPGLECRIIYSKRGTCTLLKVPRE